MKPVIMKLEDLRAEMRAVVRGEATAPVGRSKFVFESEEALFAYLRRRQHGAQPFSLSTVPAR